MNFQMFNLVLEKAEEPEIKLPTSSGGKQSPNHWVSREVPGGVFNDDHYSWGFPGGSVVKNLPITQEMQETQLQSLCWEDPL